MAKESLLIKPSPEEVEKYLKLWEQTDKYIVPEKALLKLFNDTYPLNIDIRDVLTKVTLLNQIYSTNLMNVFAVAKHIVSLDVDMRLMSGDISLIDDIASIPGVKGKQYSFATKYCSHHNSSLFPIYDSYVVKVLKEFNKTYKFAKFTEEDLKDYKTFKNILNEFKHHFELGRYSLKQIDQYIWLMGKTKMPNKY